METDFHFLLNAYKRNCDELQLKRKREDWKVRRQRADREKDGERRDVDV